MRCPCCEIELELEESEVIAKKYTYPRCNKMVEF